MWCWWLMDGWWKVGWNAEIFRKLNGFHAKSDPWEASNSFVHDSMIVLKNSPTMINTTQLTASKQISLPLLLSPHITLHIQTSRLENSTRSFLTTTNPSTSGSLSFLGSFVYAMPNVSILLFSTSDICSHRN